MSFGQGTRRAVEFALGLTWDETPEDIRVQVVGSDGLERLTRALAELEDAPSVAAFAGALRAAPRVPEPVAA